LALGVGQHFIFLFYSNLYRKRVELLLPDVDNELQEITQKKPQTVQMVLKAYKNARRVISSASFMTVLAIQIALYYNDFSNLKKEQINKIKTIASQISRLLSQPSLNIQLLSIIQNNAIHSSLSKLLIDAKIFLISFSELEDNFGLIQSKAYQAIFFLNEFQYLLQGGLLYNNHQDYFAKVLTSDDVSSTSQPGTVQHLDQLRSFVSKIELDKNKNNFNKNPTLFLESNKELTATDDYFLVALPFLLLESIDRLTNVKPYAMILEKLQAYLNNLDEENNPVFIMFLKSLFHTRVFAFRTLFLQPDSIMLPFALKDKTKIKPKKAVVNCPNCSSTIPQESIICPSCKMSLPYCSYCSQKLEISNQVLLCPHCNLPAHQEHVVQWLSSYDYCSFCQQKIITLEQVENIKKIKIND
jgi:hypothetical protein